MTDLPGQLAAAFDLWLRGAAADLFRPAIDTAGQLLFRTPAVGAIPAVGQAWTLVRDLADGLFVVAVLWVGVLVMTAGGYDARYTAKRLLPRIVAAAVLANSSLAICGGLIELNNVLVGGVVGAEPGRTFVGQVGALIGRDPPEAQFLGLLIVGAAALAGLFLVVVAIGRDLLLVMLTALAPLLLAATAVPQLDDLARLWWRMFGALLFVQVLQAGLIAVSLALLANTDWLGVPGATLIAGLTLVALLYLLARLPFIACRWALERPVLDTVPRRLAIAAARGLAV